MDLVEVKTKIIYFDLVTHIRYTSLSSIIIGYEDS